MNFVRKDSNVLVKDDNKATMLNAYLASGKRWYEHWRGLPIKVKGLGPIITWLHQQLSEIRNFDYVIDDVCPAGGRWTHTLLQVLHEHGVPIKLTYNVYGIHAEHCLTLRDALGLMIRRPTYDKTYRVRTYRHPASFKGYGQLISEVKIQKKDLFTFFKPTETKASFIMSMDALQSFDEGLLTRMAQGVRNHLSDSGTFMCNVVARDYNKFNNLLKQNKLEINSEYKFDGDIYIRVNKT